MIKELEKGQIGVGVFRVASVQKKQTKTGKDYYDLVLSDYTGSINGKVWDASKVWVELKAGLIIEAEYVIEEYADNLQVNLTAHSIHEAIGVNPIDFCEKTIYDCEAMLRALHQLMDEVNDVWCKKLLQVVFNLPEVQNELTIHSAASSVHHNVVGGWLEHTLFVTRMVKAAATIYKDLNKDLMLTSAILHDLGKLKELSPFPENEYTIYGNLVGHIAGGAMWINSICEGIDGFPEEIKLKVLHCILAHHGKLEWGSPKVPAIPEAFVIHTMDNLDAKLYVFRKALDEEEWKFNRILETVVGSGAFNHEN